MLRTVFARVAILATGFVLATGCVANPDEEEDGYGEASMALSASSCPVTSAIDGIGAYFLHKRSGASVIVTASRSMLDAYCNSSPTVDQPLVAQTLKAGKYDIYVWAQDPDGIINSEPLWILDQQVNVGDNLMVTASLHGGTASASVTVNIDNASF